ncbi:hypothetical protein GCM10023065_22240 [Microbacterium laevaniformans]|uniref:DUF2335 domain-containing protein n=1 Tax=Microbacterium laevaniformans TaxID=36807 RepID=UPI0019584392|nr:DUF2335 domain-containing protein [Microbacterium laevaniformans]MBM7753182.1 putative membrane protein [Microbacterium laevaniformans]GLJ65298.1 hypothetical protein GCM10017578_21870 [Microbacterium laevaniformans]
MVGAEISPPLEGEDPEEARREDEIEPADDDVIEGEPETDDSQKGLHVVHREMRSYRGPLPSPETLERYKEVDSRFPDEILAAFREQRTHRQEMERTLLAGSERRANRGQWLGTGLLGVGLAGGIWVTLAGQSVTGGLMVTAALALGALSYVFGDSRKKD